MILVFFLKFVLLPIDSSKNVAIRPASVSTDTRIPAALIFMIFSPGVNPSQLPRG